MKLCQVINLLYAPYLYIIGANSKWLHWFKFSLFRTKCKRTTKTLPHTRPVYKIDTAEICDQDSWHTLPDLHTWKPSLQVHLDYEDEILFRISIMSLYPEEDSDLVLSGSCNLHFNLFPIRPSMVSLKTCTW